MPKVSGCDDTSFTHATYTVPLWPISDFGVSPGFLLEGLKIMLTSLGVIVGVGTFWRFSSLWCSTGSRIVIGVAN
eukprot:1719127-Ditylum_brightwellii.AAC.1